MILPLSQLRKPTLEHRTRLKIVRSLATSRQGHSFSNFLKLKQQSIYSEEAFVDLFSFLRCQSFLPCNRDQAQQQLRFLIQKFNTSSDLSLLFLFSCFLQLEDFSLYVAFTFSINQGVKFFFYEVFCLINLTSLNTTPE